MNYSTQDEVYHSKYNEKRLEEPITENRDGKVFVVKKLKIYDVRVYEYIHDNPSRHLARIDTFTEEDGILWVYEECIPGITLEEYIKKNPDLDNRSLKEILVQICEGVKVLHSADPPVIHRDIKSSNIMIDDHKNVVIIDYDAAKLKEIGKTRDTRLLGTAGSAAPEQYGFSASDERTDIYGIGMLIKELCPDSGHLLRVADKATRMDPDRRYQNTDMLMDGICGFTRNIVKVPGFRSGCAWKAVISCLIFGLILFLSLTYNLPENTASWAGICERVSCIAAGLALVDLFTGWTRVYCHLPLIRSRNRIKKVMGYILWGGIIVAAWSVLGQVLRTIAGT